MPSRHCGWNKAIGPSRSPNARGELVPARGAFSRYIALRLMVSRRSGRPFHRLADLGR
jgi:hypothetical protein